MGEGRKRAGQREELGRGAITGLPWTPQGSLNLGLPFRDVSHWGEGTAFIPSPIGRSLNVGCPPEGA